MLWLTKGELRKILNIAYANYSQDTAVQENSTQHFLKFFLNYCACVKGFEHQTV